METMTHEVFRVRLAIDEFMPIESLWTFRVYDGTALHVEITRPESPTLPPGLTEERFTQELRYSYVAYDCTTPQLLPPTDGSVHATYSATFYLVKSQAHGESWTIAVTATLCPVTGISGHYAHETMNEYALWNEELSDVQGSLSTAEATSWQASIEPVGVTLAPLTRGEYTLTGSLVDDDSIGFLVPLTMRLTLLPDGQLTGTSEGAGEEPGSEAETAHLTGTWTRETIDIIQEYRFTDDPSEVFAFHGRVTRFGFTGEWVVQQLEALGDWEDSERQRFDMRVTEMRRRWSPEEHALFPARFKDAARLCLLSSLRSHGSSVRLPSVLWPCVLSFCDSQWFAASI